MGCPVNGPGEAKAADVGLAGGAGKGVIFRRGEVLKTVPESTHGRGAGRGGQEAWPTRRPGRRGSEDAQAQDEPAQVARQEHGTMPARSSSSWSGGIATGSTSASVREIDQLMEITKVPQALSFVEGVIHLRGHDHPGHRPAQAPRLPGPCPDNAAPGSSSPAWRGERRPHRQRGHRGRQDPRRQPIGPTPPTALRSSPLHRRRGARRRRADQS